MEFYHAVAVACISQIFLLFFEDYHIKNSCAFCQLDYSCGPIILCDTFYIMYMIFDVTVCHSDFLQYYACLPMSHASIRDRFYIAVRAFRFTLSATCVAMGRDCTLYQLTKAFLISLQFKVIFEVICHFVDHCFCCLIPL